MFNSVVTFTSTQLNTMALVSGVVTTRSITNEFGSSNVYVARSVDIHNYTGNTVYLGILTNREYSYFTTNGSGLVTDLFPVYNGTASFISPLLNGGANIVFASGIVNSYSSGLVLNFTMA